MRIVHIFKDAYPPLVAGITRYIADLSEASARAGHEVQVHVSGTHRSYVEHINGVIIYRHAEIARALSMPLSPSLIASARNSSPDLVHVHMPNPIGELAGLLAATTIPVVATYHAQIGRQRWLAPIYAPIQQALLNRASAVLVSSNPMTAIPQLSKSRDRVHMIGFGLSPNLVDDTAITQRSKSSALRLLFVGRLVYYKGLDVLLDAVGKTNNVQLTIIGDGPMREHIIARIASPDLCEHVQLHTKVNDVELKSQYAQHDVITLPSTSRAEAFGLSLAEAMANGLPAISTRLGTGTDWVNLHNKTGLVVDPEDISQLVDAINTLKDTELRQQFANAAITRAHDLFSFAKHVDSVHAIYDQAVRSMIASVR